jgi:carbamoyl-phosphate synthase large subunit
MEIVDSEQQLDDYIATAVQVSGDSPVLIDQYLRDAIECDVDALCDGEQVVVAGVMQHIEEAGHPFGRQRLHPAALQPAGRDHRRNGAAGGILLAHGLGVRGLMNIQFAVKDGDVYLIEVNPRASRTVPFVAKAIGQPVAKIAARVMAGEKLSTFPPFKRDLDYMAVKEAVFPFARFPGVDPVLSPEMKSPAKSWASTAILPRPLPSPAGGGNRLPKAGQPFVSVKDSDKAVILPAVRDLVDNWASP